MQREFGEFVKFMSNRKAKQKRGSSSSRRRRGSFALGTESICSFAQMEAYARAFTMRNLINESTVKGSKSLIRLSLCIQL
jgi:hypothetical protein